MQACRNLGNLIDAKIVEDEALIALALSFAVEDGGGIVLESAATSARR
ncbi:MAG: hypothetical protein ACRYG4_12165 [Janthinobacterium lividum]